jgi:hypothetical protein
MWGAPTNDRTGLTFTIAAGFRQRSHSQVRVPRDSSHFTALDSSLPQPGGQGPRIYIPQEHGGPVIPPGTGFPFRRCLRFQLTNLLSESELLYDWRFTANHFVLVSGP